MSTARMGKWADVDEDEDEIGLDIGKSGTSFETAPDKDGIKTVIEYTERNGHTYKVTKKVKVTKIKNRTNDSIIERKKMRKFGAAANMDARAEASMCVKEVEAVHIELTKKPGAGTTMASKDDVEEKFYEESLNITEGLFKEKKVWTSTTRPTDEPAAPAEEKKDAPAGGAADASAAAGTQPAARTYVPPSLRNQTGKGGGKDSQQNQQEASLRVTNLSEDVKEGDLQDLFASCGRTARVYLAKDMTTGASKGFAFITYYNREDAQKAINKLNGHGYDNLILQVQWAKPRQ